jgi:predicted extracellular nuclease
MSRRVRAAHPYRFAALLSLFAALAATPAFGQVVINEILQNPSAVADSAGEWFEIYNPGGSPVDIDGWTIEDNDFDSHVINNGGPLLIPAGGFLVLGNNADSATNGGVTVDYQFSGIAIANGADELVLLDETLTEIDRVEYDGGPDFPDPNGASMSLIAPGLDNNVGANWCEASTPFGAGDLGTPGAANDCPGSVPNIVINEILQNPSAVSDSAGEWFELYNADAVGVDIDGWTVEDNDIDSFVINNGGPLVIPAGGYLVLGNNADSGTNGGVVVDYQYTGMFLSNSADELVLRDTGGEEVDRVEYDGGPTFPDPNGASMSLKDPALDNNVGANWCEATTPFGAGDLGTPGAANDCPVLVAPDIVINEIMQNPSEVFDSNGEWFEIYNADLIDVDIDGWTIQDNDFDSHVISNGGPLVIPAGGFLVLGNNADSGTNGGVTVDYEYSGVFLSNGSDELVLLDTALNEADRVEWDNGATFPDPNGASMSLEDFLLDNAVGSNWCESVTPFGAGDLGTPGSANDCFGACGDAATLISAVQGSGPVSPLDGVSGIIVEGVVVGDFQASDELSGFFVQEEDADADGDPLTSEGIFVFDNSFGPDVAPGDVVRVRARVDEFFGLTELTAVTDMAVCGSGASVTAASITLPRTDLADWETTEGMSVIFPQDLFVSDNFTQARFGEVELAVDGPLDVPTNVVAPGADALALQDLNDLSRIQLDDGSTVQNPMPLPPYLGDGNTLRIGDVTSELTGVLGYSFGSYEVHPTGPVEFTRLNARPDGAPEVGPSLVTVAGFNVLNYFTTIDDGGPICGPLLDQGCRGADSIFEFERQRDKILAALSILNADIVGLIEIENAPDDGPVVDLVDGLNGLLGAGTYDYIPTGAIGGDAIRQALIYRPAAVTPVGAFAVLDSSVDPTFLDTKNRPVLAQSFAQAFSGEVFTVAVNHLKSKGSDCDDVGDPDTGDGQGNCNLTRTSAAAALAAWLATDPTGSGSPDALIVGDLNAYAMEDPVVALETAGYIDLIESLVGSGYGSGAYSFTFLGQSGYLDHALASPELAADAVSGAALWHINAPEPRGLDYNDFNQPGLYSPDEFRSSDHDAAVVGLYPDEDEDGVWDGLDFCPGTVIPESVPEIRLGVNHFALVDDDFLFDTTPPEGEGPGDAFTTLDTAGCSCEQIIELQGLGKGLRKFGCPPEVMRDWVELMASP